MRDIFDDRMNTLFKFYYQTWTLFALATAVSVEPISSASQMVRSFLRRPPSRCSQSRWKMSVRSPLRPRMTRHSRSSGRSSTRGLDHTEVYPLMLFAVSGMVGNMTCFREAFNKPGGRISIVFDYQYAHGLQPVHLCHWYHNSCTR